MSCWLASASLDIMMPSPNWIDHIYSTKPKNPTEVGAYRDENTTLVDLVKPFAEANFSAAVLRTLDGEPFGDPKTLAKMSAEAFITEVRSESKSGVMRVESLPEVPEVYMPCLGSVVPKIQDDEWTAHVYVSADGGAALKNHTDVTDVAVYQMAGFKDWLLCPPDSTPEKFDKCRTFSPAEMSELSCVTVRLTAGEAMFVPRRTVHSARADDSFSVHLTVGIPAATTPVTGHGGDFMTDVVLASSLRPPHMHLDRVVDDPALASRHVFGTTNGKVLPGSSDQSSWSGDPDHARRQLQSSCDYCSSSGSSSYDCGCDHCASSGTQYADCGCDLCGSSGTVYGDCSCDYYGSSCDLCCSSGTAYFDASCDYCCSSGTIYADSSCDTCCNSGSSSYDAGCDTSADDDPGFDDDPSTYYDDDPGTYDDPGTSDTGKKKKGGGTSFACFPGSAQVFTKTGHVPVSDLGPMDEVAYLTPDGAVAFTTVLAMTPNRPTQAAEAYLAVKTSRGSEIVLTPNHYVMVDGREKRASMIVPGEVVQTIEHGPERVVSVSTRNATGLFSPITLAGTLFVDGVHVSSYGAPVDSPGVFIKLLSSLFAYVPGFFHSKTTASLISNDRVIDGVLSLLNWGSYLGL